jgi:hypothetical protein
MGIRYNFIVEESNLRSKTSKLDVLLLQLKYLIVILDNNLFL